MRNRLHDWLRTVLILDDLVKEPAAFSRTVEIAAHPQTYVPIFQIPHT